jgi:hypothetical protein
MSPVAHLHSATPLEVLDHESLQLLSMGLNVQVGDMALQLFVLELVKE